MRIAPFCYISIHAPREGSDLGELGTEAAKQDFYPRSPRGERREAGRPTGSFDLFLSTLPARGAT